MSILEFFPVAMALAGLGLRFYLTSEPCRPAKLVVVTPAAPRAPRRPLQRLFDLASQLRMHGRGTGTARA